MLTILKKLTVLGIMFGAGWYANEYLNYVRPKPSNSFTIERSRACPDIAKDTVNVARIEALIQRSLKVQNRINNKLRKTYKN